MQRTFEKQTTVKKSGWEKHKRTGVNCRCWILLKECGDFQCVQTKLMWWKHKEEKKKNSDSLWGNFGSHRRREPERRREQPVWRLQISQIAPHCSSKEQHKKKKSRLDRRHKTEERGQKKSKLLHTTHTKKNKDDKWGTKKKKKDVNNKEMLARNTAKGWFERLQCAWDAGLTVLYLLSYLFSFFHSCYLLNQQEHHKTKKNVKAHKQKVKYSLILILCLGVCVNKDEALHKKCED